MERITKNTSWLYGERVSFLVNNDENDNGGKESLCRGDVVMAVLVPDGEWETSEIRSDDYCIMVKGDDYCIRHLLHDDDGMILHASNHNVGDEAFFPGEWEKLYLVMERRINRQYGTDV